MRGLFIIVTICLLAFSTVNSQTIDYKLLKEFDIGDAKPFEIDSDESTFFVIDKKSLHVRSLENLEVLYSINGKINSAFYSPNSLYLAIAFSKEIKLLNIETRKVKTISFKKKIRFLNWNSDSRNFAVADNRFNVRIVETETGAEKTSVRIHKRKKFFFSRILDEAQVFRIEGFFIPNSNKILTICGDETGELWDIETGDLLSTFQHFNRYTPYDNGKIVYADVSSNAKWIVTGTYDDTFLWRAEDGKLIKGFVGYSFPKFSPNSKYLGLINDPNGDRAVRIMNLETEKVTKIFDKYQGGLTRWSKDSKTFITDRTTDEVAKEVAYLWDASTGKQKAKFKTYSKYCFDPISSCRSDFDKFIFSPNDKILLSHNKKKTKFFNAETGELLKTLDDMGSPLIWNEQGNFILAKRPKQDKIGVWEISVGTD